MNPKLRSDSVFTQLTSEQVEQLENWLFEEKLGYKEVIEKIEKEFGVETSQTALARYFRRLAGERTQEWRVETMAQCLEALATAKGDGTLQAGLFVMANMQAVQYMGEQKQTVREFTALLRAMTSAQGMEMKRIEVQREAEARKQREIEEAQEERDNWTMNKLHEKYLESQRAARKARAEAKAAAKAEEEAKKAGGAMSKAQGQMSKEKEEKTTDDQGSMSVKESAQVELAIVEPERRLEAGLAATECPNDAKGSSPEPAPEPALAVVSEVRPPNGPATENFSGITRDENGDFTINWAGKTP